MARTEEVEEDEPEHSLHENQCSSALLCSRVTVDLRFYGRANTGSENVGCFQITCLLFNLA